MWMSRGFLVSLYSMTTASVSVKDLLLAWNAAPNDGGVAAGQAAQVCYRRLRADFVCTALPCLDLTHAPRSARDGLDLNLDDMINMTDVVIG